MPAARASIPVASSSPAPLPLWKLYPLFFVAVYLSHLTVLRLPYFWDEGGYYIPAAWDFFRTGSLIPITTATNAHPPLPSILLAAWWHLYGFVPSGTRTLVCMVTAVALLAVFGLARRVLGTSTAIATVLLTAIYPIWFAQSTLAHADIFAAAFTLWGLYFYLKSFGEPGAPSFQASSKRIGSSPKVRTALVLSALLFSLAALSKETAIVTPIAIALWEAFLGLRNRKPQAHAAHIQWISALLTPILPLIAWYAYHYHHTGFVFGNPEYLRYNATANLDAQRIALSLYHRFLHLIAHMNMFVPVTCGIAALLMPSIAGRTRLPRPVFNAIVVVLFANWIAFSVLGGALLTRYLLPMYPLILLICVAEWQLHLRTWHWLAALSAVAFLAGIWVNPPYAFAPEDNLTYRDMIVLHQRAVAVIAQRWPQATVLTAWPAISELERPELGYAKVPIKATLIQNFSIEQIEAAAQMDNITNGPTTYDTAMLFSTKWAPPPGSINLSRRNQSADTRYFDFHEDVLPETAATVLHGDLVWQEHIRGEWVAILRFPRIVDAEVDAGPVKPHR